jgi:heme exporter protein A
MEPLLRFEQVACSRGGRLLFDQLDLAIAAGEAVLVTGANGVGKSSLIRLAAGLLRPAEGRVRSAPAALADEHLALDRELPLRAALAGWARLDGGATRLDDALVALGLAPLAAVPVRLLSTGQARRARLARVAASPARLWLLDEPGNGLDRAGLDQLERLIESHRRDGGAVLAASHIPLAGGEWRRLELGR